MNIRKAEKLISIDIKTLPQSKMQSYTVQLLDAWRYAKGEYGYNNDFFVAVPELKAFVPKNKWLLRNIETKLEELGF